MTHDFAASLLVDTKGEHHRAGRLEFARLEEKLDSSEDPNRSGLVICAASAPDETCFGVVFATIWVVRPKSTSGRQDRYDIFLVSVIFLGFGAIMRGDVP